MRLAMFDNCILANNPIFERWGNQVGKYVAKASGNFKIILLAPKSRTVVHLYYSLRCGANRHP